MASSGLLDPSPLKPSNFADSCFPLLQASSNMPNQPTDTSNVFPRSYDPNMVLRLPPTHASTPQEPQGFPSGPPATASASLQQKLQQQRSGPSTLFIDPQHTNPIPNTEPRPTPSAGSAYSDPIQQSIDELFASYNRRMTKPDPAFQARLDALRDRYIASVAHPAALQRDEDALSYWSRKEFPTAKPERAGVMPYPVREPYPFPSVRRPGYAGWATPTVPTMPKSSTTTTPAGGTKVQTEAQWVFNTLLPAIDAASQKQKLKKDAEVEKLAKEEHERLSPDDYAEFFKPTEAGTVFPEPIANHYENLKSEGEKLKEEKRLKADERLKKEEQDRMEIEAKVRASYYAISQRENQKNSQKVRDVKLSKGQLMEMMDRGRSLNVEAKLEQMKIQELERRLSEMTKTAEMKKEKDDEEHRVGERAGAQELAETFKQNMEMDNKKEEEEKVKEKTVHKLKEKTVETVETTEWIQVGRKETTTVIESDSDAVYAKEVGKEVKNGIGESMELDENDEELYDDAVDYAEVKEAVIGKKGWLSW